MNTREKSEIRELTADEMNHVSGGMLGPIIVIAGLMSLAISAICVADATGAVDKLVEPIHWPR
jgi:bacteriocin-like protein